jgi:hypothetical protein
VLNNIVLGSYWFLIILQKSVVFTVVFCISFINSFKILKIMSFGIEAASYYVPSLYLEIKDLAEKRGIEPAKLEKGLGLHKMGLPDVHEDAATFAAEALLRHSGL